MSEQMEAGRQWLAKARSDLLSADNNLQAAQTPFDAVCFHCQQAAEKLLKAYLAGKGKPHPITHNLFLILERILPLEPGAERVRDALAILVPYAVEVRYPGEASMPSRSDAEEAREAASQVLEWLEESLPELFETEAG